MRTFRWLAAVLAVLAAAVLVPAAPAAASDWAGPYRFQNPSSGFCADVVNGSWDNRAPVQQWTCTFNRPQEWRMTFVTRSGASRFYRISNLNGGLCLDLPWGDPANPLEQANCWDGGMQLWSPEYYPDGQGIRLRNLMANYQCLSIDPTWGAYPGTRLWVQHCDVVPTQRWLVLGV